MKGALLGSQRLTFEPGKVQPGDYRFDVGTAGSATLVLETVLPALLVADGESNLTLEGGTHNPMAPPFDFLAKAYLPLVNRLGPIVEARLVRPGFYPAGGGRMAVRIGPARDFRSLELIERGEIAARRVLRLGGELTAAHSRARVRDDCAGDRMGRSLFCRRRSEGLTRTWQRRDDRT